MKIPGNFFLVGMMGAGKTTIGRLLAKMTDKHFYDSDNEIAKRTGVDIFTILEFESEIGFRNRESNVVAELCKKENIVLATGGGAILKTENRECLKRHGTVIYLRATVDDLFDRTCYSKSRPLLQVPDPKERLQELLSARDSLYMGVAHIVIDTGRQSTQHVLFQLIKSLQDRYSLF